MGALRIKMLFLQELLAQVLSYISEFGFRAGAKRRGVLVDPDFQFKTGPNKHDVPALPELPFT